MKDLVEGLLSKTGVELNGSNPWDIQIRDQRFYSRILKDQSLGLGESYMDGWWECHRVDEFLTRVLQARIEDHLKLKPKIVLKLMAHKLYNFQNKWKAKEVAEKHYNIGNNLYQSMLDKTMNYSCGYWKNADNLDQAQQNKMELVCRKLMLKPGMKLLDIGCGWGGLAKYAAENYGVEVLGVTISEPQKKLAEERCKGLPVKIALLDYRQLPKQEFDRVVSIGMFEHVGYKNYRQFMKIAHTQLKKDGIFILHTIGGNTSNAFGDPWLEEYIFPNGMLPSITQIGSAIEGLFVMEDWHNFGTHYDKTLLAWHSNFNKNWPQLKEGYSERFYRMWNYYLLSCAACFRSRKIQLWQLVLSKNGLKESFSMRDL